MDRKLFRIFLNVLREEDTLRRTIVLANDLNKNIICLKLSMNKYTITHPEILFRARHIQLSIRKWT